MKYVLEELDNIAATSGSLAKKELLAKVSPLTKRVIQAALDPYKMYGVKQFPEAGLYATSGVDDGTELFRTLDALQRRELTGNKAKEDLEFIQGRYGIPFELLRRILHKDLRCGVGPALVNSVFPGLIPEFKVALAEDYEGEDQEFPLLESIKHDGLRCLAFVDKYGVTLKTRNGLDITSAEHIKPYLFRIWQFAHGGNGFVFDGELKKKVGHFQDSSGSARRKSEQDTELHYYVFDWLFRTEFVSQSGTMPQEIRLSSLEEMMTTALEGEVDPPVHYVEHTLIRSHSEAVALSKKRIADGEEGSIYKDPKAMYQFKRSNAWLKVKDRKTADVRVKGLIAGKGKHKGKMGAIVVDFQGQENKVGTGFSDAERDMYWNNQNILIGKMVEVSYHELTKDGNMRHSRFEKLRPDLE